MMSPVGGVRVAGTIGRDGFSLEVDITVDSGEVVAVVGRNGAGKSTLLHTVAGLVPIVSGRVTVDGETWDDAATGVAIAPERRSCGVVFQDLRLFATMSVRSNVEFGCRARGRSRDESRERADEMLRRMGVAHLADRRPASLSGGERQRVALARALAPAPRVLLLDEPLTAVDAPSRESLREFIAGAVNDFAGSVLVVSHEPADVAAMADRVVELGRSTEP